MTVANEGWSVLVSTYTDSSVPILWPPSSITSCPRHSRISAASNIMVLPSSLRPFYPASSLLIQGYCAEAAGGGRGDEAAR